MLIARWWIDEPKLVDYVPTDAPMSHVEARCRMCGRALALAGYPGGRSKNEIKTVFLNGGLVYELPGAIWRPSCRTSKGVKSFRSLGLPSRYQATKPRHRGPYEGGYRSQKDLGPVPPGVVGKFAYRGLEPRWEVELPVDVVCDCSWPNMIEPFTPQPADLWATRN